MRFCIKNFWFPQHPHLLTSYKASSRIYSTAVPQLYSTNASQKSSSSYLENLYEEWENNPNSVNASLQSLFGYIKYTPVPSSIKLEQEGAISTQSIENFLKISSLIGAYRAKGHLLINYDPLGHAKCQSPPKELMPSYYGWSESDLDKLSIDIPAGYYSCLGTSSRISLKEVFSILHKTYASSIGIEYFHISDTSIQTWLQDRFERLESFSFSNAEREEILCSIIQADSLEKFLHTKFPTEKRFGLDGCESFIPALQYSIKTSSRLGADEFVIGMAHRGRLNVLVNVLGKQLEPLFCEFNGNYDPSIKGAGDVKYHLGLTNKVQVLGGHPVTLHLAPNPSHLESINPVMQGMTKALQQQEENHKDRVVGILVHGDAALSGQGVVYETFGMNNLPSYEVGGTIHFVINNQIGFTTDPCCSRSSTYCTDIAKAIDAPVLHVNADNVEAVVLASRLAAEYRQTWKKDIIVDIIGYRRFGHNEFDEPFFTQPMMYQMIAKHGRSADVYGSKSFFKPEWVDATKSSIWKHMENAFEGSKNYKVTNITWTTPVCGRNLVSLKTLAEKRFSIPSTGIRLSTLKEIGNKITELPEGFTPHKVISRMIQTRKQSLDSGSGIDMATAEALAYGSLSLQGYDIRLSGQDVERGTFSHRHAIIHDQVDGNRYSLFSQLGGKGKIVITNSHLSEFGALGFEYGYSVTNHDTLVLWEAQFGDFVNNAQCIIDQFISSGESKWLQPSGLVMLLPHGYDGNGPEHSSGKPERFLQLCDDDPARFPSSSIGLRQHQDCNMQVIVPSTPATLFHALRRQLIREYRKPLILFTSKSLLRHPEARCTLEDIKEGTSLTRVITDGAVSPQAVKKLIFCTGQVYYLLEKTRTERQIKNIAIARIEEISPFPFLEVQAVVNEYGKKLEQIFWVQEEHLNMGFWSYIRPRMETVLCHPETKATCSLDVVSRAPSAASSAGLKQIHHLEEEILLKAVFKE